ncbi:MAG: hypothetical protein MUF72_16300, partial [Elainella sp. Prado103]|nr:hypothetical protein [Elainella sp. Prado103]
MPDSEVVWSIANQILAVLQQEVAQQEVAQQEVAQQEITQQESGSQLTELELIASHHRTDPGIHDY